MISNEYFKSASDLSSFVNNKNEELKKESLYIKIISINTFTTETVFKVQVHFILFYELIVLKIN